MPAHTAKCRLPHELHCLGPPPRDVRGLVSAANACFAKAGNTMEAIDRGVHDHKYIERALLGC